VRYAILILLFAPIAGAQLARPGFRQLDGRWIRPAGKFELREIVSVQLSPSGRLEASFSPADAWRAKLLPGRRLVAEHALDDSLWHLMAVATAADEAEVPLTVVLLAVDELAPARDTPARPVRITLTPSQFLLRGVGRYDGAAAQVEYRSRLDGADCRLTVQIEGKGGIDVTGQSVVDLLGKRPAIVRQFLAPMLRDLSGNHLLRPRAGDVYRAFDDIQPTPEEAAAVFKLLPALGSPEPLERELADEKLQRLGPSGVLAAMRLDLSRLPPEPASRLKRHIERNSLGEIDPATARMDLYFLREARDDPDPRVRDAAREQLQLLAD
jgi:hypothetical protein